MVHSRPSPCPAKPRVAPSYDTPPRDLHGSTSLRESHGHPKGCDVSGCHISFREGILERVHWQVPLFRIISRLAVSPVTRMGVHFHSCMHACIMENMACECTTKKGTQTASEWKSHGERKRKKVKFNDKPRCSSPLRLK
jgi:hypothetical protein